MSRRGMDLKLRQALVQRTEFEGGEELADLLLIPSFEANRCRVDIQRHIVEQAPELFIDPHLMRALLDGVAEFWRELVRMGDDLLNVAVSTDQLGSGLVADARNAGQIVRSFALERDEVDPLFRRDAIALQHRAAIVTDDIGDPPAGHDDQHAVADQL